MSSKRVSRSKASSKASQNDTGASAKSDGEKSTSQQPIERKRMRNTTSDEQLPETILHKQASAQKGKEQPTQRKRLRSGSDADQLLTQTSYDETASGTASNDIEMSESLQHMRLTSTSDGSSSAMSYAGRSSDVNSENCSEHSYQSRSSDQQNPLLKLWGPIEIVQDSTGHSSYTLDPFCVSYRDFQYRAEDELAKFLRILLNYAWLNFNHSSEFICISPITMEQISTKAAELEGATVDLRWQLKHLNMNIDVFTRKIFCWRKESRLNKQRSLLKSLQDILLFSNDLAHKQYLNRRQTKLEIFEAILLTLTAMIKFADTIYNATEIGDLNFPRNNLRAIRASYRHYHKYQTTFDENDKLFEKMRKREREETAEKVLTEVSKRFKMANYTTEKDQEKAEKAHKMVALQVASRFDIRLSDI